MVTPGKTRKGAGIDFVFPERAPSGVAAPSPDPAVRPGPLPTAAAPHVPRTGVGLLTASLLEGRQLDEEIKQLKGEVQRLAGERGAQALDPRTVAASRWANRHPDAFTGEAFASLKQEIADAGGNVQPIKVRPLAEGLAESGGARYEIVFGHRRHRACLELGLPVLAVIDEVDDRQLYVQMERENRGRESLSAWEQGRMYLRALEDGLFTSNIKLAAAIGRDPSDVGKATRIAKLPPEVTGAFASPLQIQFHWVGDLEKALKEHPQATLQAARELNADSRGLTPAEVFRTLTASLRPAGVGPSHPPRTWELGGGKSAEVKVDGRGRVTVRLSAGAIPATKLEALQAALRQLVD
jgi:ParB family transcriptional regulator, chromosome partitioning protein